MAANRRVAAERAVDLVTDPERDRPRPAIRQVQAPRRLEGVRAAAQWEDLLGPMLDSAEVAGILKAESDRNKDDSLSRRRLLALPTADGREAYPAFQFTREGGVHPVIARVIEIFDEVVATPYTTASWLTSPQDYLEGISPVRWLEEGREPEPVIAGAEQAAARLAA